MRHVDLLLLGTCAITGCNPYDPQLSDEPFFCGSADPKCPDGYTCVPGAGAGSAVCTRQGSSGGGNCATPFSGMLATWDFTGQPGTQASQPAKSMAPGITATMVTRSPALMASSGADSISSSNWPTAAQLDSTRYYTLAVTPAAGCSVSLTTMAIDVATSTTGPTAGAIATSADAFAQSVPVSTSTTSMPTLSVSKATGAVEVRIYGFGASATTGTMRLQSTLTLTGSLQ